MRAATVGDDKNVVFYHGAPFKFNSSLGKGSHTNYVYGAAFSPDGASLVSVGGDKKIMLYDGKTGEVRAELSDKSNGHAGSIFGVSWSKDSRSIVTCSGDRTVKTWDVEAGKVKNTWTFGDTINIRDQQVGVVWPARSDGLIISLSLSGNLNYLQENASTPTRVISGHSKSITALTTTGSAPPTLWTGDYEGRLCSWNLDNGTAESVEGEGSSIISGLSATPGNKRAQVFSVDWDDKLRFYDAGAKLAQGQATSLSSQPKAVTSTSDGLVIVAQADSVLVYHDGQEDGELPLKSSPSALTAHGTTVAIGGSDSSLRFYTVSPGKAPKQCAEVEKVSAAPITSLAFSDDGGMIAAGTAVGKIFVYKLSSGLTGFVTGSLTVELITDRWSAHTAKVTSIAWNSDGTHAVSGSLDTSLFLWSLKEPGRRVQVTNAHKEGVSGVSWLDKGLYSTGADATVKRWRIST